MKSVGKASITVLTSTLTGGHTQERDPMCVLTVVRASVRVLTYAHITQPTQERDPMSAAIVASASVRALPLTNTERAIPEESCCHSPGLRKLPRHVLSVWA